MTRYLDPTPLRRILATQPRSYPEALDQLNKVRMYVESSEGVVYVESSEGVEQWISVHVKLHSVVGAVPPTPPRPQPRPAPAKHDETCRYWPQCSKDVLVLEHLDCSGCGPARLRRMKEAGEAKERG